MKLWQKDTGVQANVDIFTVGKDRDFDTLMAPFDVLGSIAHITMLEEVGLLSTVDFKDALQELRNIYKDVKAPGFVVPNNVEDIHSYVEILLTNRIGEAGKKIHSGRSRNDQVLVDVKLFLRSAIESIVEKTEKVFNQLQQLSEAHKDKMMPGYTHLQLAMPSSFGLWFGAYAESLTDDMIMLKAAFDVVNQNPLGSAAGYGSSFPLNRQTTTALLGFESMNYNVVYAQMGRGKAERIVAQALGSIAETLAKMSMDVCLFMNQNFSFMSFPDELTTGSSIMPHKKNPDVFELIRGYCNKLKALPVEISMLTTNLPVGYHRDLQLLKESLFPAFDTLHNCMDMLMVMFGAVQIKADILDDEKYAHLFSVEVVNALVLDGTPFREAYQIVGRQINENTFSPAREIHHTHEGSIGNLCTAEIAEKMMKVKASFNFLEIEKALENLAGTAVA